MTKRRKKSNHSKEFFEATQETPRMLHKAAHQRSNKAAVLKVLKVADRLGASVLTDRLQVFKSFDRL